MPTRYLALRTVGTVNNKRLITAATAALVITLVAGACGSDNNSKGASASGSSTTASTSKAACATGSVSGAGSTFVQTIAQQWIKDFQSACSGATVNYQAVGSGAGIQQLTSGTIDFAGSDVKMKPAEQTAAEAKNGPILTIPWSAGGIAVEFHVSGVSDLNLTAATLAGIFAGKITKWDDAAIKADNPGASLPSTGIQVVHRSDGSGTTAAFTTYLTAAAPQVWMAGSGKDVSWPTGQGAKGSDGVTGAVKQADGAIGYSEVSFAKGAGLGIAKIKNSAGQFVGPTGEAVSAYLAAPSDAKAYPISTETYVLVPKSPKDAGKAALLKAFVLYALNQGQQTADSLYYAPLPTSILSQATTDAQSIGA
jgi:phosphate transport system substrate-binding protein